MPRDDTTGVFTRVDNSFSEPVLGTIIDEGDADAYFDDIDAGITNSIPKEPTVVTTGTATITAETACVAINRTAPATTALALPTVAAQNGVPLHIVDYSQSVTTHTITLTPSGSEKIMRQSTWQMISTSSDLQTLRLIPSVTLGGWYFGK